MARPNKPDQPPLRPRLSLLRCLCCSALGLILLIGLVVLIIWLVVRPTPLDFTVDDAKVHRFNITTGNALNATFNLNITSFNSNRRVALWYDEFDITVWYADQTLAVTDAPPFFQGRRNTTTLHVDAAAQGVPLTPATASGLKHGRSAGTVQLVVKVEAKIRFKLGLLKTKHFNMKVYCSPVVVHFMSASPFDRTHCDVDI